MKKLQILNEVFKWRHDNQHNDTRHNNTSIKGLFVTLSINDTQHNNNLYRVPLCSVSCFIYCLVECHYAKCRYAECHYAECHYAYCHYVECRGAIQ
jgi:hypothetical protein